MPASSTKTREDENLAGYGNDDLNRMWGNGDDGDGHGDSNHRGGHRHEPERTPPPEGYRLGIRLTLISITMMFLALTSAYIVNRARIQPLVTPRALYVSTAILMLSSATIELARRFVRRRQDGQFKIWMSATLILGFCFLGSQLVAWRQLVASGFYVNKNTHSGYAYVFTAMHGVHLIGGLAALSYLMFRSPQAWTAVRRRVAVDSMALYWHFIDGLWIFLFALIFFWK